MLSVRCVELKVIRLPVKKMRRGKKKGQAYMTKREEKTFDLRLTKLPHSPKGPSRDELLYAAYKWTMAYETDQLRIDVEVELNRHGH